jgi:hypothetical protein
LPSADLKLKSEKEKIKKPCFVIVSVQIVQAVSAKQFKADQPQADSGGQPLRSVRNVREVKQHQQERPRFGSSRNAVVVVIMLGRKVLKR